MIGYIIEKEIIMASNIVAVQFDSENDQDNAARDLRKADKSLALVRKPHNVMIIKDDDAFKHKDIIKKYLGKVFRGANIKAKYHLGNDDDPSRI
jgi:hypothetical protein